ncbi:EcsC family protein [Leptolyngbya sp. DQ-M1]|uniref:EcsC family protein n=1 Tax=Leptolyngbya sp. DQ-M1 TaxID=2933920 RepID=UPI0032988F06
MAPSSKPTHNSLSTRKSSAANVFDFGRTIAQGSIGWIGRLSRRAGHVLDFVGNFPLLRNPIVRRFAGVLKLEWLIGISNQVDLEKAEEAAKKLQRQFPDETAAQIAHRLIVKKAVQAGSTGFVTSILPGFATALLALDLAATTALQTALVYEIAAAYGLNLREPERKGEVLAIFGLALGGSNALKAGLRFLRNVPFAGAAIGASTNATILYSLGYAASRFYEAKLANNEPETEILQRIHQQSENYLNLAINQQAIMDQVLAQMLLASYPGKTWESILPDLKTLQLEPSSLKTIETNLRSPQPLGALLDQLDCDFAAPLLAQCRRIAESKDGISSQEAEVLSVIEQRCNAQPLNEVGLAT